MRIFVTHDVHGTIVAMGSPSPDLQGIGVKPKPGHHVAVLNAPQIEHPGHLLKHFNDFRIDTGSGKPKLVKK